MEKGHQSLELNKLADEAPKSFDSECVWPFQIFHFSLLFMANYSLSACRWFGLLVKYSVELQRHLSSYSNQRDEFVNWTRKWRIDFSVGEEHRRSLFFIFLSVVQTVLRPLCDFPCNKQHGDIVSRNPRRRMFRESTKSRFKINGGWFVYIVRVVCETNLLIYLLRLCCCWCCYTLSPSLRMQIERETHTHFHTVYARRLCSDDDAKSEENR